MSTAILDTPAAKAKRPAWSTFLKRHPLFSQLEEEEVNRLLAGADEREFDAGQTILEEGEVGSSVFFLGSGSAEIVARDRNGDPVHLATLRPGEFFGDMAVLDGEPRSATVRALSCCLVLEVGSRDFLALVESHPQIAFQVLGKLSERVRQLNERVLARGTKDFDEQLALLDNKINAECKVFEASLKAAQAFFEQTKMRTDEVIASSERNRTRMTVAISAVGGVLALATTLFGYLGVQKMLNLEEFDKKLRDAESKMDRVINWSTKLDAFEKTNEVMVQDLLSRLNRALDEGNLGDAVHYYDTAKLFGPDRIDYKSLMDQIERQIVSDRGIKGEPSAHLPLGVGPQPPIQGRYGPFLLLIRDDLTGSDKLRAHYLWLAGQILVGDEGDGFSKAFAVFKKDASSGSIAKRDLVGLDDFFQEQGGKHQERYKELRAVIRVN